MRHETVNQLILWLGLPCLGGIIGYVLGSARALWASRKRERLSTNRIAAASEPRGERDRGTRETTPHEASQR
jgi:hypothetical protein